LISGTDTNELRALHATGKPVISLYLNIPVDLAEHRLLSTRARELMKSAAAEPAQVSDSDQAAIGAAITARSQDWLGQTVAFFACADAGLFEVYPLPGHTEDLAVIAGRPYLRPWHAVRQRNPGYQVAVIDAQHAWVLAVSDDDVNTLAERTGPSRPSSGFAGWYGLEAYRMQQRVIQLTRRHYRDTIGILAKTGTAEPLVIGGQEMLVSQFLAQVPDQVSRRVAGSFSVDLQTATPARVRELSAPVIADWTQAGEAQLVNDLLSEQPGTAVTTNLADCLTAVRSRAVSELVLTDGEVVPGCVCADCGALGLQPGSCDCADPAGACHPVPDLLDELSNQALDGGGQVAAVREAPFTAAARLRFRPAARSAGDWAATGW
jgi:peptide chain release factor subunit 1